MPTTRAIAFIDGFNLYHAVDDLGQSHLKWLDLWKLCTNFTPSPELELVRVFYFSAYATWLKDSYERHRAYVKALSNSGVTPVMGRFKQKDRRCRGCGTGWLDHEEKETDVNIATYLLLEGIRDRYNIALLISGDSDLVPAVGLVRQEAPAKQVRVINPPGRNRSLDLLVAASEKKFREIKPVHLERSLFPKEVRDTAGQLIVQRPSKYDPPGIYGG